MKILLTNKKFNLNYQAIEKFEAGIVLKGTEVKSIVKANASIDESFVIIKKNEAFIINMHVAHFKEGNIFNVDVYRTRKLLLHKKEILNLEFKAKKDRLTIIPSKIYLKNNKIKLEIVLAKSKNVVDKRETIKKRDLDREIKNQY